MLVAADNADTLIGLAAVITACGGLATSILAARSSKREASAKAEAECEHKLMQAWRESEAYAQEVHDLKIKLAQHEG